MKPHLAHALVLTALAGAGCKQILGIEPFEPPPGDEPGTIDAPPAADAPIDTPVDTGPPAWTGHDHVMPSRNPPGGLRADQVPQFVVLTFDENPASGLSGSRATGGMSFVLDLAHGRKNPDGSPVQFGFFHSTTYIAVSFGESPSFLKRIWHTALVEGHDLGNHGHDDSDGAAYSAAQWLAQIDAAEDRLTRPYDDADPDGSEGIGADRTRIYGFRAPKLAYNDAALKTANARDSFWYDSSIQEGFEDTHEDGTRYYWPYTLDEGSPGDAVLAARAMRPAIGAHPGLWELPIYALNVPPDSDCVKYGLPVLCRETLRRRNTSVPLEAYGRIPGTDDALITYAMTNPEALGTLKYSFDQRLKGNRAPFILAARSLNYSSRISGTDRQAVLTDFLTYVLSKPEVRVVGPKVLLDWLRYPRPL
jgi:hypothetical protein